VHSDGSLYGTERKRFSIEIAREVLQSIHSNSYRQQLKGAMRSKNRHSLFLITVLLVWICFPALLRGATSPVHLPVSLDYSFIRSVFVNQVFTQPANGPCRSMQATAAPGSSSGSLQSGLIRICSSWQAISRSVLASRSATPALKWRVGRIHRTPAADLPG